MKKITILLFALFIVGVIFLLKQSQSSEERYLSHIYKHRPAKLEGPEKSVFRDVIMTMNPQTGDIPVENRQQVIRSNRSARTQQERNFQWEQIETEVAGRARAIMIDPNDDNKLWLGAATGGLWYNPNFRANAAWVPVSDDWESLSISSITYDPNNPQVFYAGTGESFTSVNIYRESTSSGVGIYKTTDGGTSWSLLPSTSGFEYTNDIVVKDEDGISAIYAAVVSGTYQGRVFGSTPTDGLYKSVDGGGSWEQVLPSVPGSSVPYAVSDIELLGNGELYIGTMRNLAIEGGGYILHSVNGVDWDVNDRYRQQMEADFGSDLIPGRVVLASGNNKIYAAATGGFKDNFNQIRDFGNATRLMSKSVNDESWSDIVGPSANWASIPWHALALTVDPSNDNNLVVGGLDVFSTIDAANTGSLSWARLSDWSSMYYFSNYLIPYYGLQNIDSVKNHFVHADIHKMKFTGSNDEFIAVTDGGVQFTSDFSKGFATLEGERLDAYPTFGHINNSLATTQYYTVALNPEKGNDEVLVGSQDNSTHTAESGKISYSSMIGGGDGAYCFFDRDDRQLRITSSQSNVYNYWIQSTGFFRNFRSGTFINPGIYDDRSNLLYLNMAVDGGYEALNTGLEGRFLDTLGILNVNEVLGKDMLGLGSTRTIKLGTNTTVAFSAFALSPYNDQLDATLILGNQLGDLYKVEGLPYGPLSTKIDNDELPVGYVSAVDIGETNDEILVTLSNYGVNSVWYTDDGGDNWESIERNLPDIPVRDAKFNPLNSDKIIIATEVGIWGLESVTDRSELWQSYNNGLPNVRVDMIDIRESDKRIALATHGRGAFLGTLDQGEELTPEPLGSESPSGLMVYPNPTDGEVRFNFTIEDLKIYTISGREIQGILHNGRTLDLSTLKRGTYLIEALTESGQLGSFKIVKK